ncbi:MAG: DUF4013 domain-containing protein [Anaerolineae bacterium]|nr:DUF4013 domain-containing protein [Anaerolineae bacterium]
MDFGRALTYAFDDRQWTEKLIVAAIMVFLSAIPLLGLVALAGLLGWVVELIQNMQDGRSNPMPRWDNIGDKIALGGSVLIAILVYSIPNLLLACCAFSIPAIAQGGRSEFFAGSFAVGLVCCLVPLLLLYNVITWPMLAIGTVRYSEVRQTGVFYQFGDLFSAVTEKSGLVIQWLFYSFIASLLLSLINVIPCIGWLVSLALTFPIQGHLLGQFARALQDKPKGKPKRA